MNSDLQERLQQVVDAFHLPGMAVVLVEQGEISGSAEFGYANLAEQQPFTIDTICLIASVTKSFTAGLAGCMVDAGLVEWTRPVHEYIADFKMMDEFATREITLEDMLCHRSGLPWHENLLTHGVDRELPDAGRAFRAQLLKRMAHFDPSTSFRSHFQYQDIVYTCAGAVLEHVADEAYETLMERYLLHPLGMEQSTFARSHARASGKLAQSYALVEGQIQSIAFCDTRYIAPSAGLYSSAREMAQWLKLQLAQGRIGNAQIISAENLAWIQRPHMATPGSRALGNGVTTYGQGWFQSNLHGQTVIGHGGSFNGHRTFVGFLPEKEAGVIVVANLNLDDGVSVAGMMVLDHLLGVEAVEQRLADGLKRAEFFRELEREEVRAFTKGRNPHNPPAYDLQQYEGVYSHPGYGVFTVALASETLEQTYEGRTFPLQPYDGNTLASHFQSTENRLLNMPFAFESDNAGQIVALRVPLIPDIPTPCFTKEP